MTERKSGSTGSKAFVFRVTGMQEAGPGRVTVTFAQENVLSVATGAMTYANSVSLNLSPEEAATYFPGQLYDVVFTAQPQS